MRGPRHAPERHPALFLPLRSGRLAGAASGAPAAPERPAITSSARPPESLDDGELWEEIRAEAKADTQQEPALASFLYSVILAHSSLDDSLAFHLANKLASPTLLATQLMELFKQVIRSDPGIQDAYRADLRAVKARDPACRGYSQALLYFKGFQAVQAHRVAHALWQRERIPLALALQSRISDCFHVDIHPAARVGKGILLDHATGVVIGETAVIGDDVSILHGVTLGGTGKETGDRHPKIGNGVLLAANVTVLGNITIGDGSKIGAGSLVLKSIPPHVTAVGVPARVLGRNKDMEPAKGMDQTLDDYIGDYVI
eukprot:tig00021493_g21901.t1